MSSPIPSHLCSCYTRAFSKKYWFLPLLSSLARPPSSNPPHTNAHLSLFIPRQRRRKGKQQHFIQHVINKALVDIQSTDKLTYCISQSESQWQSSQEVFHSNTQTHKCRGIITCLEVTNVLINASNGINTVCGCILCHFVSMTFNKAVQIYPH